MVNKHVKAVRRHVALGNCTLKQGDATPRRWEWLTPQTLTTPDADEDVEQQELLVTAGGHAKGRSPLGSFIRNSTCNCPAAQKPPSQAFVPEKWDLHLHKILHMNDYSSCIQNSPKRDTAQMCGRLNVWGSVHTMECYWAVKGTECWYHLKNTMESEKQDIKDLRYDTIPFVWHIQRKEIYRIKSRLVVAYGWAWDGERSLMLMGFLLGLMEMFQN